MTSGLFKRTQAAAPSAVAWVVATILLILHGTAPGALQLQSIFELRDVAPTVSSDARDAHRGTLPRVQALATAVEAGLPKTPKHQWNGGGKPFEPPPSIPAIVATKARAAPLAAANAASPLKVTRFFDPRGPPR